MLIELKKVPNNTAGDLHYLLSVNLSFYSNQVLYKMLQGLNKFYEPTKILSRDEFMTLIQEEGLV